MEEQGIQQHPVKAPLRVAVVGCGIISEAHARAYARHADRARITACFDISPEKAEHLAGLVASLRGPGEEAPRTPASLEDILADPEIDAVEVCTPHPLHAEAVIAAARAGKHILCQKPFARTLAECDAMIAAAQEAGVILFYGESNRTSRAAVAARRAVEEGRIGQMIGIQATHAHWQGGRYLSTAWRYDPKITGGGQLLDGGIHAIDLMLSVGGPIEAVSCFFTRFRPELGGEDTAVVNARYAAGHLGTLFSSQAAGVWPPTPVLVAYGTEGVLTIGGPHGALALHRSSGNHGKPETEVLLQDGGDSFTEMIGRYLDTVLDGTPHPAPAEVGRDNLRVVHAAYESARRGQEVRIADL